MGRRIFFVISVFIVVQAIRHSITQTTMEAFEGSQGRHGDMFYRLWKRRVQVEKNATRLALEEAKKKEGEQQYRMMREKQKQDRFNSFVASTSARKDEENTRRCCHCHQLHPSPFAAGLCGCITTASSSSSKRPTPKLYSSPKWKARKVIEQDYSEDNRLGDYMCENDTPP